MKTIASLVGEASIGVDHLSVEAAREKILSLGIPRGSLGALHGLAELVAGIRGCPSPSVDSPEVIVFCGDHGVTVHGVSAFPSEVTRANMELMVAGRATISVFCSLLGVPLTVVDVGVRGARLNAKCAREDIHFVDRRVAEGTGDVVSGPALTSRQVEEAVIVGFEVTNEICRRKNLLIFGEMGIGNTTIASLICATLLGRDVDDVVGLGSGVEGETLLRKKAVVRKALNRVSSASVVGGIAILREFGGLELAAMVGGFLAAAKSRTPVLLDGFIVGASALLARAVSPWTAYAQIPATLSAEKGHQLVMDELGGSPILSLGMRLGEGSAAVLAVPLLQAAVAQLTRIAVRRDLSL